VLANILSSGRSFPDVRQRRQQKQLASGVAVSASSTRGPGLFQVGATALPGKTIADLEAAIYAEIEKIKTGPIADWEMEKARNTWKRSQVNGLASSLSRAMSLGRYALFWNDPNLINTYPTESGRSRRLKCSAWRSSIWCRRTAR
jgi:predicted Zn-dependent peptidase